MKSLIGLLLLYLVATVTVLAQQDELQPARDLLNELRTSYAHVHSFTATMQLENFEEDSPLQRQKVWFKRPGYILLKQVGPYKQGAELAILPNGSIRGHLGGFLSFAVTSLDKDDANLYGVTHDYALNVDFDKVIDMAEQALDRVQSFRIESMGGGVDRRIVLDSYYDAAIDHIRLLIDPQTMLIAEVQRFRGGRLIHQIQWNDIRTNVSIGNDTFDL